MMLVSCKEKSVDTISFDGQCLNVGAASGTAAFIVRSNTQWKLSSDADWFSMNITKGAQGTSVIVSYRQNPSETEPRSAVVTGVTLSGSASASFTITQMPSEPFISFNFEELPVSSEGKEHSVEFETNLTTELMCSMAYQEESDQGWISDLSVSGKVLKFKTAANTGNRNRSAVISVYGADDFDRFTEASILVVQSLDMNPSAAVEKDFSYVNGLESGQVQENIYVKGTIVIDGKNPNFPKGFHTVQDKNGSAIVFRSSVSLGLNEGDNVTLWLLGTDASVKTAGDVSYIEFSGLGTQHVMASYAGTPVEPRRVHINELDESMLHTLVSLQQVEISVPFGAYVNYNEYYVTGKGGAAYTNLDRNYATSIRDINGDNMYMLTCFDVPYRRKSLPQGSGYITGILVSEENSNMGDIGRWQIRHRRESDIAIDSSRDNGFTDVLVEWTFDMPADLIPGQKHIRPAIGPEDADISKSNSDGFYKVWDKEKNGKGQMYFGEEYRGDHPTNAAQTANTIKSAALFSAYWDTETYWLISNLSTEGINSGLSLQLESNSLTNTGPRDFSVEWSLDGKNWTAVENGEYRVIGQCNSSNLHSDHIPGYKPYDFKLPEALCNQPDIYIRLRCSSITDVSGKNGLSAVATNRLGHLSIKYNK